MNGEQETVVTQDEETREPETEERQEQDAPEQDQPEAGSEEAGRRSIEKALEDMGIETDDDGEEPAADENPAEGNQPKEAAPAVEPKPAEPAKDVKPEEQPKPAASPEQEEAELVKSIPLDRLLVETDATEENAQEVPRIEEVALKVAEVRGVPFEELVPILDRTAGAFVERM